MISTRLLRTVAGVLVLLALVVLCVVLIPPYAKNWKLQRYVNGLIEDPGSAAQSPDAIRDQILDQARTLGLPVQAADVHVTRPQNSLRIDVLYIVHVDFAGYVVDLHFRPAAGTS